MKAHRISFPCVLDLFFSELQVECCASVLLQKEFLVLFYFFP